MPTEFDDPDDSDKINDALREERKRMYGSFWNPEKESGPKEKEIWDDYVAKKQSNLINKLNISSLFAEIEEKCPLLQQPRNSEVFFYCQGRSDASVKRAVNSKDDCRYTHSSPKIFSAELSGILQANTLSERCTNKNSFHRCKHYKDHKKREND